MLGRFIDNNYPLQFLESCLNKFMIINQSPRPLKLKNQNAKRVYIKTPFINDYFRNKLCRLTYQLKINDNVHFYNKLNNLSSIFKPKKHKMSCPTNCNICPMMNQPNICLNKNLIYCMKCTFCNVVYIGETSRCLITRVREHLTNMSSAVYQHHLENHIHTDIYTYFSISIMHANIPHYRTRLNIEAHYIRTHNSILMNGCLGSQLQLL